MSDPHTVLQLTDVTRVFGGTPVLSGVTLSVPGQACVGIRGASGAGKSTLARIVAGVDLGFEGTVTGDATRSHLVYQDSLQALNPRLPLRWTLAEALGDGTLRGIIAARRHGYDEMTRSLQEVGLDPRVLSMRPGTLSGGQRQRVSL
ncbi:MAG TPA: ATP-binding cassette domain-containing protein, partial [Alkalispirochaeta sp.]|nr:ATP-binding cassette domain-containing protein [Alkalispirochaeta sp.]